MDFETMVRRGLGRAVLYARENDVSMHRDFLLHACLHNIAFDPQLEMTDRARYMSDLLDATCETGFYTEAMIAALQESTQEFGVYQIYEILSWLGFRGNERARQALYDAVAHDPTQEGYSIATSLVKMDKLPGFLYVLEQMIGRKLPEHNDWRLSEMYEITIEEDEEQTALNKAIEERPHLAPMLAYLCTAQEEWKNRVPYVRPPDPAPDYAGITHLIKTLDKRTYPMRYTKWGTQLDEETIERLAKDTLTESDPERLRRYLYLFEERIFPLDYGKLLEFALDPEYRVAYAARGALGPIVSQSVRNLAIQILSGDGNFFEAVDLLNRNYEEGDWRIVENVAARVCDPEEYHGIALETINFFEDHFSPDAATTLFHIYERVPCSNCRGTVVENLLILGELPDWMIQECLHDASEDTRDFARSLLAEQI